MYRFQKQCRLDERHRNHMKLSRLDVDQRLGTPHGSWQQRKELGSLGWIFSSSSDYWKMGSHNSDSLKPHYGEFRRNTRNLDISEEICDRKTRFGMKKKNRSSQNLGHTNGAYEARVDLRPHLTHGVRMWPCNCTVLYGRMHDPMNVTAVLVLQ